MSRPTFTRRTFLASSAIAPTLLRAQEFDKDGARIKLGIASYSFRKFSRAEAIRMTKQLDTPYLNIKDFHLALDSTPDQIDAARKEFADAGITIVGVGTIYFKESDTDGAIRHRFEYTKRLGAPLIVCAPAVALLPKLETFVKEYDIKIAIHNHGPEDKVYPSPQSALAVVKDLDPRCGICMDIGHTARTGADPAAAIAEAGPRLLDMHAKDLADFSAKESQVAVGEGKMPMQKIFAALIHIGYKGCVNLEYEIHPEDPMPGMTKSMAYMRKLLAEATA